MKSTECTQTAVDFVESADEVAIAVAETPNTGESIAQSEGRWPVGANTKIEWCDFTFNPWRGCQKVAPGCANCYAEAQSKRNPKTLGIWGPNGTRVVASEAMWREPAKWDRNAERERRAWSEDRAERESLTFPGKPERPRVFSASLADVFEEWTGAISDSRGRRLHVAPSGKWCAEGLGSPVRDSDWQPLKLDDVRARLFRLIDATPHLDWLLLTKRPENIRRMVHDSWTEKAPGHVSQNDGDGRRWKRRKNVWLGTSIACQEDADRNIPELLKCRGVAAKLFLSIEPLVGPVDLSEWLYTLKVEHDGDGNTQEVPCRPDIDWVIVGGESGPNARPCDVAWIRDVVSQCKEVGVPVFVKQLGAIAYDNSGESRCMWPGLTQFQHHNGDGDSEFQVVLNDPKGGDPSEWPEDLRVREVPA